MSNGTILRFFIITFLSVALFNWVLGIESILLLMLICFALWGLLEFLIYSVKNKQQENYMAKTGLVPLTEQEKKEKKNGLKKIITIPKKKL